MKVVDDFNYETDGLDGFLSRSIDSLSQVNLDSQGPQGKAIRYDDAQVSGMLGDTLQIGNVKINKTNITLSDGTNTRLLIGEDVGGF